MWEDVDAFESGVGGSIDGPSGGLSVRGAEGKEYLQLSKLWMEGKPGSVGRSLGRGQNQGHSGCVETEISESSA